MIKNDIEELRYKKMMVNAFGEDWETLFDAAYSAVCDLITNEAERDISKRSIKFSRYEDPFKEIFDYHVFMQSEVGRSALTARFKKADGMDVHFGYDPNVKYQVDHLITTLPMPPEYLESTRSTRNLIVF